MNTINKLNPVSFRYKDSWKLSFGVIAQELPESVAINNTAIQEIQKEHLIYFSRRY